MPNGIPVNIYRSPISLLGCPASFQRLVELAMRGLVNVIVYIDNQLVHCPAHSYYNLHYLIGLRARPRGKFSIQIY
jgi:hypothetical protein